LLKAGTQPANTLIEPFIRLITQVERARSIVEHFRRFLRRHPIASSTVDVNRLLKETIHLLAHELGQAGVEVRYELTPQPPHVVADPVMIEQVAVNLVMNALEAMSSTTGRPRHLTLGTTINEEGACTVTVRDSGPGLLPLVRKRLFDAFVTTKPRGLGLGLSISRSIIEQHGGKIWHEAAEDGGAVFRFMLPKEKGGRS
jgi:C4-dicarboxylate-specific signal transduction histidine kinase